MESTQRNGVVFFIIFMIQWIGMDWHCYCTVPGNLNTQVSPSMLYGSRRKHPSMQYTPRMLLPCLSILPPSGEQRTLGTIQLRANGPSAFGEACSIRPVTE